MKEGRTNATSDTYERMRLHNLEVVRNIRQKRRENGLCTECGGERDSEKYIRCQACRARHATFLRNHYARNRAKGLCVDCGKPAKDGTSRCMACKLKSTEAVTKCRNNRIERMGADKVHENERKYHHAKREVFFAKGLCVTCGKEREDARYKNCLRCRQAYRFFNHQSYERRKMVEA